MTDQKQEEIVEIESEQLQELLGGSDSDKLPPIEIPLEFYDTDAFHKGIQETSHLAGVITALLNTGVDQGFVLDFLLNKETVEHNIKVAEINRDMNIQMSKHQKATQDKFEL